MTRLFLTAAGLLLVGVGGGCQTGQTAQEWTTIRARAAGYFEVAWLAKPAESTSAPDFIRQLAPLIVQEAGDEARTEIGLQAGYHNLPPEVFFSVGEVLVNDQQRTQITYCWPYPTAPPANRNAVSAQGVRVTLDAGGRPAIWEVLADTSGAVVLFVSRSLEAAVRDELGVPLIGRHLAVERDVRDTPTVVVAGCVDDAPVTIGPIVHVQAATHDITTVICRCSATQARTLAGQRDYQLIPTRDRSEASCILEPTVGNHPVTHLLRLPRSF